MAADLHIHVFEGVTEKDLALFFSHTLGSKYFNLSGEEEYAEQADHEARDRIIATPQLWIGEVSWLKAALLDAGDTFVPDAVQAVSDLIGEDLPVLDDELAEKIRAALRLPNTTGYSVREADDALEAFFVAHKGKRLFTISW